MASAGNNFLVHVIAYTTVIFGTMFFSGKAVNKTVYDSFVSTFEGNVVLVHDRAKARRFYVEVLDFKPIDRDKQCVGVELPDGRKLLFQDRPEAAVQDGGAAGTTFFISQDRTTAIIRVRNGFRKLHTRLVEKAAVYEQQVNASRLLVGPISDQNWGHEFTATDPDGNQLIFFDPKHRAGSRY